LVLQGDGDDFIISAAHTDHTLRKFRINVESKHATTREYLQSETKQFSSKISCLVSRCDIYIYVALADGSVYRNMIGSGNDLLYAHDLNFGTCTFLALSTGSSYSCMGFQDGSVAVFSEVQKQCVLLLKGLLPSEVKSLLIDYEGLPGGPEQEIIVCAASNNLVKVVNAEVRNAYGVGEDSSVQPRSNFTLMHTYNLRDNSQWSSFATLDLSTLNSDDKPILGKDLVERLFPNHETNRTKNLFLFTGGRGEIYCFLPGHEREVCKLSNGILSPCFGLKVQSILGASSTNDMDEDGLDNEYHDEEEEKSESASRRDTRIAGWRLFQIGVARHVVCNKLTVKNLRSLLRKSLPTTNIDGTNALTTFRQKEFPVKLDWRLSGRCFGLTFLHFRLNPGTLN